MGASLIAVAPSSSVAVVSGNASAITTALPGPPPGGPEEDDGLQVELMDILHSYGRSDSTARAAMVVFARRAYGPVATACTDLIWRRRGASALEVGRLRDASLERHF